MHKMKIPQILTLIPFQGHMYKPKTSNFTFLNVKPDVFGYLQIFCGETGIRRVPRGTTVFKTAAIDHSATSPKLLFRSAFC